MSALAVPAFALAALGAVAISEPAAAATPVAFGSVVPAPVTSAPTAGVSFTISASTTIYNEAGSVAARAIATQFAVRLRASTGLPLAVADAPVVLPSNALALMLSGAPASVGTQGYQLDVTGSQIVVRANQPAGLFAGVQTLRQLLPVTADAATVQAGPWTVPGGHIVDHPRFAQRGMMLDVARHFFPVSTVQRLIDQIALYKINTLHLHLSDDQGWRIAISSWPRLATIGGSTAVGGDPGGYYTAADYTAIV